MGKTFTSSSSHPSSSGKKNGLSWPWAFSLSRGKKKSSYSPRLYPILRKNEEGRGGHGSRHPPSSGNKGRGGHGLGHPASSNKLEGGDHGLGHSAFLEYGERCSWPYTPSLFCETRRKEGTVIALDTLPLLVNERAIMVIDIFSLLEEKEWP